MYLYGLAMIEKSPCKDVSYFQNIYSSYMFISEYKNLFKNEQNGNHMKYLLWTHL